MKLIPNIEFNRLKESLSKTRQNIFSKISNLISGSAPIDAKIIDEIENVLISSDLGSELVDKIIKSVRNNSAIKIDNTYDSIKKIFIEELSNILPNDVIKKSLYNNNPKVIIVIGINGSGKTTTVAKLAYNYKKEGRKVLVGSADTFRAAANDQLKEWTQKYQVDIIEGESQDPAAVVYNTINVALKENYDLIIIDTAGRLQNNKNLMEELSKIFNVVNKLLPNSTTEVYITLDANSGQNLINQALEFNKFIPLTGFIITKLDGTAKGGAILNIAQKTNIPIHFLGIGEQIEDLILFNPKNFIEALFS